MDYRYKKAQIINVENACGLRMNILVYLRADGDLRHKNFLHLSIEKLEIGKSFRTYEYACLESKGVNKCSKLAI